MHMLPEYAQARKALWGMVNPHTGKLRIDEAFPPEIRETTREDQMMIKFKSGSTWQLAGSDNYNAMMGTSYAGMVFSEFALGNPSAWGYFSPILAENGGWGLFITTPRGHNHAESMLKVAQTRPDWFWEVSPASKTGALSAQFLMEELAQYQELYGDTFGRSLWLQEYECSFDAAIPGAIFGEQIDKLQATGRISEVPHEQWAPVHTGWDLGYDDDTVIWWFQVYAGEIRVLDYYSNNLKDIDHYAQILEDKRVERGFTYGTHYLPHDARPRTLAAGGKSMYQQFHDWNKDHGDKLGTFQIARNLDLQEQIQAARATLAISWIDGVRCADGIESLRSYHRKWDDEKKTFTKEPVHDWSSHASSAFMTISISWREAQHVKEQQPVGPPSVDQLISGSIASQSFGALKRRHLSRARAKRSGLL